MKFQISNSEFPGSSTFQIPNRFRLARILEMGAWNFFGAWNLEFGIFPRQ
jgi:hypothetical protein